MSDLTHRVVSRLYHGGSFSRNKNFLAYTDPQVVRGRRIWRHLRALRKDLHRAGRARVRAWRGRRGERGFSIVVRLEDIGATRVAFVSEEEMDLLCDCQRLRAMLDAGGLPSARARLTA